jgi:ethanolamine ammonia-lyase large subunit
MNRDQLARTFVLANELKEGDLPLGGTRDDRVREEARREVASVRVGELVPAAFVDDGVSEALARSLDPAISREVGTLTVGELRRRLLAEGARWAEGCRAGLSSEAIAAVVKIMTEDELARVARSLANPLPGEHVAIGSAAHLGSRIQPNSPGDDEVEILFSILEGLAYGCGDVILGLNPACDDVDSIVRLERLLGSVVERLSLPTRFCVLSDIVKQTAARAQVRVDVGFQSLAGTSKALAGMVGLDAAGIAELAAGFRGLYFETGQGSEVTNGAADGIDMVTLEARTYGVARAIRRHCRGAWTIVNDVAGFIGPEVFRSPAQLERACLEDLVMAKLHGLTMGLDVCSTFHMGVEPAELARRTLSIAERGAPAYLMAVAGNADPMLGYLTTSFREHPRLRRDTGRRIATAMERRLAALGALATDVPAADRIASIYAAYAKAGGERRSHEALADEARRTVVRLRANGFDLGHGDGPDLVDPQTSRDRLDEIYAHARRALYATLAPEVIADACRHVARVRTASHDRDDYLAHPVSGERIADDDASRIQALRRSQRPRLQIVVSDGLNADAVNENLRAVLPAVRRGLHSTAAHPSETDVVIVNGRVRAGYHVGALLEPEIVVHLIGERPGTGLNTLSAYLTYGRDPQGGSRWRTDLDHSATTAICGVHRRGKPPELAAQEIVRTVMRMLGERRSGVALAG